MYGYRYNYVRAKFRRLYRKAAVGWASLPERNPSTVMAAGRLMY